MYTVRYAILPPSEWEFPEKPTEDFIIKLKLRQTNSSVNFSKAIENKSENFRNNLKKGASIEYLANQTGGKRILFNLYLKDLGKNETEKWLPDYDSSIHNILTSNLGDAWLRLVAMLFFQHYGNPRMPAVKELADFLLSSYQHTKKNPWGLFALILFHPEGPCKVIETASDDDSIKKIVENYKLPKEEGGFVQSLRRELYLKNLAKISIGEDPSPIMECIEEDRESSAGNGMKLGAAALQIMVGKQKNEGHGQWAPAWAKWISRIGSDPRYNKNTAAYQTWWGWASEYDLQIAQSGMTGITIEFFIGFLRDSLQEKEEQFKPRKDFLLELYKKGKIIDARLVLNQDCYYTLPKKFLETGSVAKLDETSDETSIICLKCVDDIYIIEGTHSFALRLFRNDFPLPSFWQQPKEKYLDKKLRIASGYFKDNPENAFFLRHSGDWRSKFFNHLRNYFHIEWIC